MIAFSTSLASAELPSMADAATEPEMPERHPLQFKWTLWHDQQSGKGSNWGETLRAVASFDTVEDFWALFNNLQEPSQLPVGSTYNLFKHGIEPKWEDVQNASGGEWRCPVPSSRKNLLDEYWVNSVLTVIGEGFAPDESDDIAGIVVNIRRGGDRIAIWTKSAVNQSLQESIGMRWRETAVHRPMDYTAFKEVIAGGRGGKQRGRYHVE